jgi:hypothetical protein
MVAARGPQEVALIVGLSLLLIWVGMIGAVRQSVDVPQAGDLHCVAMTLYSAPRDQAKHPL